VGLQASDIAAVVLAGGFGTRIRHLLADLPKPMAPVAEKPFVEWVVRYLKQQGISRIGLSTGYLGDTIEAHFQSKPVAGVETKCVRETDPLGTAGGFWQTAQGTGWSPKAWLVLNGDSLALADLKPLWNELGESDAGALLGLQMEDAARYGTLKVNGQKQLVSFEEKRPGAGLINAGVYLLRHELLAGFPAQRPLSFERDVFGGLLAAGKSLRVVEAECAFLDIGTPETLPQATEFVLANRGHFA
jgi:D-glycero-alpha-D-manno-heptose 1-phosphate guanylyltransferase